MWGWCLLFVGLAIWILLVVGFCDGFVWLRWLVLFSYCLEFELWWVVFVGLFVCCLFLV